MNVLFIQPFVTNFIHPCKVDSNLQDMLIWVVYLENFLKHKIHSINSDLLFLPIEKANGKIKINSVKEKKDFYSQMDKLTSNLNFEIDKNTTICVSVPTSFHYLSSKLIAEYLKNVFGSSVLIFGGTHATACPDDFAYSNSPIDYVITNEGEITLYNLLKNGIKKQKTPILIKSHPIPLLDELPPLDFSIYEKYTQSISHFSINLSRGCPYSCNFCMEKNIGVSSKGEIKKWRSYSPKRAIQEIKHVVDFATLHNINLFSIHINDPIFGMNKKWLNDFLSLYDFELNSILIESRIDILNEKILTKLYKKHFYQMYGLESCSPQILKLMNKTINPNRYLEKFRDLFKIHQDLDYLCVINFVLNYPGESEKTILESLENFKDIVNTTGFSNFALGQYMYEHFPNTEVYNNFSYYKQKFGSISYFPEWWKDERTQYGAYCVKASKDLPLKQSLNLFLKFNKEIGNLKKKDDAFINLIRIKIFKEKILEKMKEYKSNSLYE